MLNSRASCALGSPAVARCRRVAACSSDRAFLRPRYAPRCLARRCPHAAARGSGRRTQRRPPSPTASGIGHRRVLASEHQALLQELDAHAALSQLLYQATQVIEVAGQPIHAVHHHCIAFADEAQQRSSWGAGVLARCLVGEHLAHLVCSSWRSGFWSKLLTRT